MQVTKRGFTLIELLIVVAIIAILAAIAIPNFLMAQVRAKVAKAKAEMNTLAMALEAYDLDYNEYVPYYRYDVEDVNGAGPTFVDPNSVRLRPLTTPISYISSIPKPGPFGVSRNSEYASDYDTYDYADEHSFIVGESSIANAMDSWGGATWGYSWRLASPGPTGNYDYAYNSLAPYPTGNYPAPGWPSYYDPSNGTVSNGDIVRFSSSIGNLDYGSSIIGPIFNN